MTRPLNVVDPPAGGDAVTNDCWNRIGVWGDRSCPELAGVVHCQNCPVFSAAGRRFLNTPSLPGYMDEWTDRLAEPADDATVDRLGVLIFRLADEWLALSVAVLVEVTPVKPVRRVPHRGGVLAGLVNVRGELYLCARLDMLLGVTGRGAVKGAAGGSPAARRLLVVRKDGDRWVFPVDEIDQVHRIPAASVGRPPATVGRAAGTLSLGVFDQSGRTVGLLDEARVFEALRAKIR